MSPEGSVTRRIGALKAGDAAAVPELMERYFSRLVGLARTKLENAPRAARDEHDVALSAFATFCRRAQEGRFPELTDRECLWQLLVVITARKASHQSRDEYRHGPRGEAALVYDDKVLNSLVSPEPDPAFAAQMAEECARLLGKLADPDLEMVALRKMEGYTVEEIAIQLGWSPRTVKRMLRVIRGIWQNEGLP